MRSIVFAGLLLAATAAQGAPSDLVKCDGYGGRRSGGEQAVRSLAIIATLGIVGAAEPDNPAARLSGRDGALACSAALSDERVTANPVRRGEVLLAKALHNLVAGEAQQAFADAEQARTVAVAPTQRFAFDRTIGASALLTAAYAQLALGNQAAAEELAGRAIAARPYGALVDAYALMIMHLTPAISPPEAAMLERRSRTMAAGLLQRSEARITAGDWAGAADDLRRSLTLDLPKSPDLVAEAALATTSALSGASGEAEAVLVKLKDDSDRLAAGADEAVALRIRRADEIVRLARIQLALNKGDIAEARVELAAQPRWLVSPPLVAGVLANARARGIVTADDPAKLIYNYLAAKRTVLTGSDFAKQLLTRLPRWEDIEDSARLAKALQTNARGKSDTERDWPGTRTVFIPGADAFVDSMTEASLVTVARMAAALGHDRFVVFRDRGAYGSDGKTAVARPGQIYNATMIAWLHPGDAGWAEQAARAITVADIERDLGGIYPKPAAPVAR